MFILLTFLGSNCLHLFVYIYARLLCSPFELAEGSSPFGAIWREQENPKGQPYHRATVNFLEKDLVAECIDHERRMKVLDPGPPQETEFYCYLGFCSVLLPCYCYYLLPVS